MVGRDGIALVKCSPRLAAHTELDSYLSSSVMLSTHDISFRDKHSTWPCG
jgi:hypothetical protein